MFHITQLLGYFISNRYWEVMSKIPKKGHQSQALLNALTLLLSLKGISEAREETLISAIFKFNAMPWPEMRYNKP